MPNRLANATSPYLRQHAENPVDWWEWTPEAFEKAKKEDKPVMLSVGYAACHWCHVMAHESFESTEIAKKINDAFVPIKVDREERPDIDQIYQTAIQVIGAGGGWPLTAFLLPDGRPFFGGTYFPPDDRYGRPGLPKLLEAVLDAWTNRRQEVLANADQLAGAVKEVGGLPPRLGQGPAIVGRDLLATAGEWLLRRCDPERGGFGAGPKFPNTMALEVLSRWAVGMRQETPAEAALFSLGKMAEGGIYDHLGGGFHRYSVDGEWHVPHFEKMLYDNALLARSFVQAWQLSRLPWCRLVAVETLGYLVREIRDPGGAFYASTDADSEPVGGGHAEEGLFFCWKKSEIDALLDAESAKVFALRYDVTAEGNWENGLNVLRMVRAEEEIAKELGKTPEEIAQLLAAARKTLFEAREKRPRPFRDEKLLVAWNGLAISAFAMAGAAFGRSEWTDVATRAAEALLASARDGKRLLRAIGTRLKGTAEDYANLAEGLIDLWEATLEPRWLDEAAALAESARELFAGEDGEVYLTGGDAEALIQRPLAVHDQSVPAASAVLARVWLRLSRLLGRDDFERAARRTIERHQDLAFESPFGFASMVCAWDDAAHPVDVVFAGPSATPEAKSLLAASREAFAPTLCTHVAPLLAGAPARSPLAADKPPVDGKPTAYVCRDRTCSPPTIESSELAKLFS